MPSVALISPPGALAPEIPALATFLNGCPGFRATVHTPEEGLDPAEVDVVYRLMGLAPRWVPSPIPEVHDYASLSTGRLPRVKNALKRFGNRRPVLRSFLNPFVRAELGFTDDVPHIVRDMGVPPRFVQSRRAHWETPDASEFDLVYVGSLSPARGLRDMVENAVRQNLTILLVGEPSPEIWRAFGRSSTVEFTGRVPQDDVPELCLRAWAGVSHVPDTYPFTHQTATKILEYCALGMPVVTNSTAWSRRFQADTGARFLTLDSWSDLSSDSVHGFEYRLPARPVPTWTEVFVEADIASAIRRALG